MRELKAAFSYVTVVAPSHLKSFQALELAVRTGSLKAAADVLAITPAAVGQRVKTLEDYLGMDLLVRGRSGLSPTPALAAALPALTAAFRELAAAADTLDLNRGQEIHIAAHADIEELWLSSRLPAFKQLHPNVTFSVNGAGDAPFRLGPPDCEIVFAARREDAGTEELFADFVLPICSQDYAQRIAPLPKRDRLEGLPLFHLDFYKDDPVAPNWAAWAKTNKLRRSAPERGIRYQRIARALDTVRADAGPTICGLALIAEAVDSGEIALPFTISTGVWTEHVFQARFRQDALIRPQVRRFRAWLKEEAETTRRWLDRATARKR